jgi:hypothetical protein
MARLPSSFRARNRTSQNFREQFAKLPDPIKQAVRGACSLFDQDLGHPSLRHHQLKDVRKGKHAARTFSVSPTMQYRALYVVEDDVNVWYWIGTHAEYKKYTGSAQ